MLLWLACVAAGANGLLTVPTAKRDAVGKAAEHEVAAETQTTRLTFEQGFDTATRRRPGCVDDTSTSDVRGYGCDPWYDAHPEECGRHDDEGFSERHGKHADAYAFIEPIKDRLFPANFDYLHRDSDGVETTTTQVLFGDLVAAVEYATDQESSGAESTSAPDFKPGTNAQRHSLHRAKHASKHGSARVGSRLSMANIFGSSGSSHSSVFGSVDAPAPAEPSDRPRLARSLTWRASPPVRPPKEPSAQV